MTHNQLRKLAETYQVDLKYVTHWAPPNATDLRPLIAMPNVPKPLHGVAPRTVLGTTTWNKMRRECYEKANDTCEICGDCPENKRKRQAHEVYVVNYATGESVFIGCVCLCQQCHLACIHNGRAITLYSKGSQLITADYLLEGAEKAFTIVSSYNKERGADVRLYSTWIEYLKHDELREPMLKLIKKTGVKFYSEDPKKLAKWKDWKLLLDGEEYPTPYANEKEWEKAMEKKNYNDNFGRQSLNIVPLTDEEVQAEHDKLKQF